jgi:predicted DNA-binding protein
MKDTVRKNFVFTQETAEHLEELAKDSGDSMTAIVQELIEKKYRELRVKNRLEAFKRIDGCATGLLGDFSVQSVKANMHV